MSATETPQKSTQEMKDESLRRQRLVDLQRILDLEDRRQLERVRYWSRSLLKEMRMR